MVVRYTPTPEFQLPSINFLGAMAQGETSRLQELQQEKLAQQLDLQRTAAGYAANRDIREAEKLQSEQSVKEFELASKKYDALVNMAPRLTPQNYGAWHKQVTETFPLAAATLPAQYNPEVMRTIALQASDLKPQVLQQHFGDTSRFMRVGPTGAAEVVPGSEATAARKPEIKEINGELYSVTPDSATPIPLFPAGRGQAGAFEPSTAIGGGTGTQQDMTTALIKQREGFIEKPKYDVNAYRAGYGSDTVTLPDGTVQKIEPGMKVSREDAERDLQRRIQTEFVPKAAAKVGERVWSGLPENTRAALTSVAYNYGTIPSRLVPAVQSGDPEVIARGIEGLAGDNKGINASRRMQEAGIARGVAQPPANMMAAPAPMTNAMILPAPAPAPAQSMTFGEYKLKPLKEANTKFFSQLLKSYEEQEKAGVLPSTTEGKLSRAGKILETSTGELGRAATRVLDPKAQELRDKTEGLINQYIQRLRESGNMTGGEGNTLAELEAKKAMLGRGNMTIGAIRDIVRSLDENLGTGKLKPEGGSVIVNVPGMGAVPFPSREAAEAFKRDAGLQ